MAQIPENILGVIQKYINEVSKEIIIDKVIIFGSYTQNLYNKDSDIDLAIFSRVFTDNSKIKNMSFLMSKTSGLGIDLQPQAFTMEDYENPEGFIKEIVNTGIEIQVA